MSAAPRFSTADIARGAQRAEPPQPAEPVERVEPAAQTEPDAATIRVNEGHHILEAREAADAQQLVDERRAAAAEQQAAADGRRAAAEAAADERRAAAEAAAADRQAVADRQIREGQQFPEDRLVREDRQLPEDSAAPLFASDAALGFQRRWDGIQAGFVDDPRHAVEEADALVAETMQRLAETFAQERERIEQQLDLGAKTAAAATGERTATAAGAISPASTEELRIALRHYRSFFKRLLSV